MPTPFFKNKVIEIYEPVVDDDCFDRFGEPEIKYVMKYIGDCDFQPMSPEDMKTAFGEILQGMYKVYLSEEVLVSPFDIFKIKDENDTYELKGAGMHWNTLIHHQKLILQKQRKPTEI